jgi:ribosomal protein S18 acetylase RimI-like enzyme
MPEIEIRPAVTDDIPKLIKLDHNYETSYVWRMEIQGSEDGGQFITNFHRVKLPRVMRVIYPRSPKSLVNDWTQRAGLLVASLAGESIAYTSLSLDLTLHITWMTDLIVESALRRKGIGSALLMAALEWGANHASRYLVLEMQPKNYPAFKLVQKFGFEYCGYNDRYFANQDIGIFFAKSLQ